MPLFIARRFFGAFCCLVFVVAIGHAATTGGPARKGFKPPTAPPSGPAPFLTEAIDWDIEANSKIRAHLFYPTKRKVEQPFYDIPFAVNVPFEIPFDGGVVRVFFDVNIVWDEPEQKARVGTERLFPEDGGWVLGRQGIYRLDGAPLTPENIEWEISGKEAVKMTAPQKTPFPFLLSGVPPTADESGSTSTSLDINSPLVSPVRRPPFRRKDNASIFASGRPVVFRSAQPGWYALWFTLNPQVRFWPPVKLRSDDTLRAKIRIHYIVARRDRFNGAGDYFFQQDLSYLWEGADVKPTRPLDPNLVRVHSLEIPVVLRRDGWVFSRAEIRRHEKEYLDRTLPDPKAVPEYGRTGPKTGVVVKAKASPNASGVQATYQIDRFERKEDSLPWPANASASVTLTWDVTMPAEIPDGGVGEIAAKGGVAERGWGGDIWNRGVGHNASIPVWMRSPGRVETDRDKLRASSLVEQLNETDKSKYLQYWAAKLGDPGASKYFPAPADDRPPRSSGETKKHRIFAPPVALNASRDLGHRQILYQDMGPQPLFSVQMGPWEVDCYYRRKKDLDKADTAAPGAGPATIANEKDPFWDWFVTYCRMLTDKMIAAQAAFAQAAPRGDTIHQFEGRARKLLEAVAAQASLSQTEAVSILNVFDAAKPLFDGTKKPRFTPAAQEAGRVIGQSIGAFAEEGGRIWNWEQRNVVATMSERMFNRLLEEARKLTAQAQEERRLAVEQMNEGLRYYDEIDAELSRAYDRFGEKHPELLRWRTAQGIEKAMKRYAFAAATNDIHMFREAVEASGLADIDPSFRLYEAKILRDTGDWPGAVFAVRRAIAQTSAASGNPFFPTPGELSGKDPAQLAPDLVRLHLRAELMLREMECAIMRSALEKSQGALAVARGNFYHYLQERGFGEKSQGGVQLPKWWQAATGQDRMSREDAWAIVSTGITGALSGIMGRPGTEAEKLGLYETKMTTGFIGLHLMIRLRERGLTLRQIADLRSNELQSVIPLRRPDGREYTPMDIVQCRMAIFEALKFPEIAALLAQNDDALRTAMSQGYWSESDITTTWIESFGDFTSPKNLFLTLLPMSVGTVGGSTQGVRLWSASRAEAVAAMRAIGAAESGTIVMARVMGLQRALTAFRTTGSGAWMADKLIRAHNRYEQLGVIDRAIWHAGKATAVLGLMAVADVGIEHLAGKEAAFAAQMIIQFATDEELLLKFAYGNGHNPRLMAKLLDTHFIGVLRRQIAGLKSIKEEVGVWEKVMAEMKKGTDFLKLERSTRLKMAQRYALPAAVEQMPTPDPGHNVNIALQASAEAVANNTDDGSLAAARALLQDVERDAHAQTVLLQRAEGVAATLAKAEPSQPLPERRGAVLDFPLDDRVGARIPPQPAPASKWAQIEQATQEGRFDEADALLDDLFVAHRRAAAAGQPLTKNELPAGILAMKRRVVRARVTQLPPPATMSVALAKPIEDAELEAAMAMTRLTPEEFFNKPGAQAGSSGKVEFVIDANRKPQYVVKEVVRGSRLAPEAPYLQAMAEGEALTPDLLRMVGLEMPSARVKLFYDQDGKPMRAVIVSRFVDGRLLNDLSPEELYAFRNQLAASCPGNVWVGNYDRKGDNYFGWQQRAVQIDAGQADPCGTRAAANSMAVDDSFFIDGYLGRDHQYRNGYGYLHSKPNPADWHEGTAKWFMMEQSFTYQEAMPTVNLIKELMANRRGEVEATVRKRLTQLFADSPMAKNPAEYEKFIAQRVTATMDTLEARAAKLEESMRGLNARNQVALPNGMKIPVTSRPDTFGERHAAAEAAAAAAVTPPSTGVRASGGPSQVEAGGRPGVKAGKGVDVPTADATGPGAITADAPGNPNRAAGGLGAPRDNRTAPPTTQPGNPPFAPEAGRPLPSAPSVPAPDAVTEPPSLPLSLPGKKGVQVTPVWERMAA